jgi:large subunit ribosomal protein L4
VVDAFVDGDTPSTKSALKVLAKVTERPRALVVLDRAEETVWLSLRNVPAVHLIAVDQLNPYDVLCSDDVVFTKTAFDAFVEAAPKGRPVASTDSEEAGA